MTLVVGCRGEAAFACHYDIQFKKLNFLFGSSPAN